MMNCHDLLCLAGVVAPRPLPVPARTSGGGRSRAATPFACGAGTLWRRHAHRHPSDFLPRLVCDCGCPQALRSLMSLPSFPPCPREPPVVGGVALRLRLPAEQALCGEAMPIAVRAISFPASSATVVARRPRESPVVDGVALRLRLPAEQALCGEAMPIAVRVISSPASSATVVARRPLCPFRPSHRLANPRWLELRAPFHRKSTKNAEISLFTL
jgi:hypothetical protein